MTGECQEPFPIPPKWEFECKNTSALRSFSMAKEQMLEALMDRGFEAYFIA